MREPEEPRIKVVDRRRFYLDDDGNVHERETDDSVATVSLAKTPARNDAKSESNGGREPDDGSTAGNGHRPESLWARLRRKLGRGGPR